MVLPQTELYTFINFFYFRPTSSLFFCQIWKIDGFHDDSNVILKRDFAAQYVGEDVRIVATDSTNACMVSDSRH